MSTNVGAVDFDLLLNSNPFNSGLKNAGNAIKSSGIENALGKIGKVAITAFSIKAITDFTKGCLQLGSDLAEVQNVVDVTFGSLNNEVNNFAKNAIDQFGLGQTVTKKYVGTFGAMAKAFNFNNQEALKMSETLTGLSGDVASFYNLSSDEAYTKLKSVFTGETETLKDLGVVMTQSALDQYALANSYGKTTAQMSEQEKVALRYKFVLDKLNLANGDFARTSDSWANQTRVLSLRFNELKATLGQGFINIFTPIVKGINFVIAKLQVLANAFKSFTEFITGKKTDDTSGIGSVSSDVSNLTGLADDASNAVGGIGSSAKKTAKQLKNLASFDTAQILKSDNNDSSSGSGSGGASGGGSIDFGKSISQNLNEADSKLNPFFDKLKELAGIFKEGFDISFGNTNFDGILKHLNVIKDTLINIWTDSDVLNSAKNWVNTFIYSLGQRTGAIARVGTNIAEFFLGGIDKYLSQNIDRIKNHITTMFNISIENYTLTSNLWQALGEISDVFKSDISKQIGADIIAMFANPFMSLDEVCEKFGRDLQGIFFKPIIDNTEKIKKAFNKTLKPIQKITGTLAEAFTYIGDKWNEVYDKHIKPLMDSLKTGLSDTFGKFLDVYNENIAPFLDYVADGFNDLWIVTLKPLVDKVGEVCGKVADNVKDLWNKTLKPAIDWIVENVIPAIVPILEDLWDTIKNVCKNIAEAIDGVMDVFSGLTDFITGVFTGDWKKAWEGIKTFFNGIWEAIKGIVSAVWEAIKGIVEKEINLIKGVIETVFNAIKTFINNIWNGIKNIVSSAINGIKSTVSNVFNAIKNTISNIWNGIKTTITNIINGIKTTITNVFSNIKTTISNAWNKISSTTSSVWKNITSNAKTGAQNAWNGIKSVFSSVGSFFQNTFTNAWTKVKNVFSKGGKVFDGIKEGIISQFKKIVNALISGINKVIANPFNKINEALNSIRNISIIGAKPFSGLPTISIPQIPKLAQGAYVKANTPQLAMIGDNRHQGEIVAPEDKLENIYRKVLKEEGIGSNANVVSLLQEIVRLLKELEFNFNLYIDGRELSSRLEKIKKKIEFATNGG